MDSGIDSEVESRWSLDGVVESKVKPRCLRGSRDPEVELRWSLGGVTDGVTDVSRVVCVCFV